MLFGSVSSIDRRAGLALAGDSEDRLNVEFTQHSGDEMYHPTLGEFGPEWELGEH